MSNLKPFAFVLMPFDEAFSDIYKLGIQDVCRGRGVVAERVDEQRFSESILERIYRQIETADFIIADMTRRNPNVFYEVGYAHAKGKLCTLLTSNAEDIPFDLRHHRHLVYSSIQDLRLQLESELTWLIAETQRRKATTISIHLRRTDGLLVRDEYTAHVEATLVFDLQNQTEKKSPEIEALYFYTGTGWEFLQDATEVPSTKAEFADYALRHFIRSPVSRLSPGAWAQVKIIGKKRVWTKWDGTELKQEYRLSGRASIEAATSEGSFRQEVALDVVADEIPF